MRSARASYCILASACLVAAAACGLQVVGVEQTAPSTTPDGGKDGGGIVADAASACATLDASCLALPSGWSPVDVSDAGCAASFTATTMFVNPTLAAGACSCSACTPTGAYTCTGTSPIHGGDDNCGDDAFMTATQGVCANGSAQHLRAEALTVAHGTEGCTIESVVGPGATADTIDICAPTCAADVCATPPRCVIAPGAVSCPSGYSPFAKAGTSIDAGCAPCACDAGAPAGNCGGSVLAFANSNCSDASTVETYSFTSCNTFPSDDYQSVWINPVPPDASCAPSVPTPGTGTAVLDGVSTVCCR